jgi:thiamine pyrophosphate-dependent acetolactate synthase large subunit-like protein
LKGSAAIASILKREGVECLFCFPVNGVIDAAAEQGIRPIMARHERTVVGMADGYSRATNGRKIGVCATQYGPGAENAFGGVAQAFSDNTPILFLPGGVYQNKLGSEPGFDALLSYQKVTKWVARVNQQERIPELFRRAFTYLRNGRRGPVALELPMDLLGGEFGEAEPEYNPVEGCRTMADPARVAAAVKLILAARRPLLHAGLGVLYAEASPELVELAELLQAPVMTTLPGKSGFPEDHPLSIGSGGFTGPKAVAHYLAESDLVFGIGSSLTTIFVAAPIPAGKSIVQLTVDDRDLSKDYPADCVLMGDAKLVLQQMVEEVRRQLGTDGRRGDDRVAREIASIKGKWLEEWMPLLTSNEIPLTPYRVIWELQHTLDLRNSIVTHDAGTPRDQISPFWPALEPNSFMGYGKSTHLGYSLPLALGAKVARPEKTVVNFMGDAAFGMSGMEIANAARNKIGTITILLNNSCLGGYDKHIPNASRIYGTRFIPGVEYARVAEGLGAYAERVEKPDEIAPAIRRALKVTSDGRPALLEMITREENRLSKFW